MQQCLICNNKLTHTVDLNFILSFKKWKQPVICSSCQKSFTLLLDKATCQKCGRLTADLECLDCQRWNDGFVNKAMFQYDESMQNFFNRYKFQGDYLLRTVFQDQFVNFIQKISKENELLIPVPVDQSTMNSRGFNQVTGLVEGLKFSDFLVNQRTLQEQHQYQRNRRERLSHRSTFEVQTTQKMKGMDVLLIDDIYTTGTTLRQAAKILKKAGVQKVRSVTLCR